jgi:hypothetical protein
MLQKIVLLCLGSLVGLALPALAAEEQDGPVKWTSYSITMNEYSKGEEVGCAEYGNLQDTATSNACQVCAPSEPGGIPACFLLILPPKAWTGTPWPVIKQYLHGHIMPPLRETMLHGIRLYYYFPDADDVKFTISEKRTGEATERFVESVTIAQ